jgi:N utilization substance protein B
MDMVRKLYLELKETEDYKIYISENSRDKKPEKQILEYIFNDLMLANESFESHLEEIFPNWGDDAEMMQKLVTGYLNKTTAFNFEEIVSADKALFARELLAPPGEKKSPWN